MSGKASNIRGTQGSTEHVPSAGRWLCRPSLALLGDPSPGEGLCQEGQPAQCEDGCHRQQSGLRVCWGGFASVHPSEDDVNWCHSYQSKEFYFKIKYVHFRKFWKWRYVKKQINVTPDSIMQIQVSDPQQLLCGTAPLFTHLCIGWETLANHFCKMSFPLGTVAHTCSPSYSGAWVGGS